MYVYRTEIEKRLSDVKRENVEHTWSTAKKDRNNPREFIFYC